jgi:cold shock CspA family protein
MLTPPLTGEIVYWNNVGQFGFIEPDFRRPDDKDVHFHRRNCRAIREDYLGSPELASGTHVERDPHKGERVVYYETDHRKGPTAYQWNYFDAWKKAQTIIANRPWPECPLCRIVRQERTAPHGKMVIWEGYHPFLEEIVAGNDGSVLQAEDLAYWYHYTWCEELRVEGWDRMDDPRDRALHRTNELFTIPADKRQTIERFELARLIEDGELLRPSQKIGFSALVSAVWGDVSGYAVNEIGCALLRKFGDIQKAHLLLVEKLRALPESDDGQLRTDYSCARLLGLPFELINACGLWLSTHGSRRKPENVVKWLRTTSCLDMPRAGIDRYRKLVESRATAGA